MKKNIGGDRLGSGAKMSVHMKEYGRSTHDLGYLWRSSMSAGTLVPFMNILGLPGDTFDITLDADVKTVPPLGPLFGSFKLQMDIFTADLRLYNAQLHNNELGIGLNMQNVLFPQIVINSPNLTASDNSYQINPSNLVAYLGIRGLGYGAAGSTYCQRSFNAMPLLAYWDIFKNYYANKQETNAYVISGTPPPPSGVSSVKDATGTTTIPQTSGAANINTSQGLLITFAANTVLSINLAQAIRIQTTAGAQYSPSDLFGGYVMAGSGGATPTITFNTPLISTVMQFWIYYTAGQPTEIPPTLKAFALSNIDSMRTSILSHSAASALQITSGSSSPYMDVCGVTTGQDPNTLSQQGLAVKTYQSDRFNNWMQTTWQTSITTASQISTAGNVFTIDQLNLGKKVYDLLNRVAISGGSYQDWIETVYTDGAFRNTEIPMYHGGLSKELLFQEVVSMAATNTTASQPLGTLASKGTLGRKHKGGKCVIHVKEPTVLMGIVSLTPRIDYSQGNHWVNNLVTMNDLHKPALDEIGFQNLVTDEMAFWDTIDSQTGGTTFYSAGLQPAWIQYMTNVNQLYGNFAIPNNQMFMTLNRRYTQNTSTGRIQDLTTYIDPSKFNFIFAQTSLDAQNFWVQLAVNIEARRVMSARIIPNL